MCGVAVDWGESVNFARRYGGQQHEKDSIRGECV